MPLNTNLSKENIKQPPFRKLKGYAFDPSLSLKMDTAEINRIVYKIPWEELEDGFLCGEYIEVIDFDPTIKRMYKAANLNHPFVLAQDGLEPSESNPQFHQQMVYAVAMTTIKNFEKALGRKILWAPRLLSSKQFEEYVPKLRIYPHALREANAYYSPQKKALLFGYFSSVPADNVVHMPDSLVFTCLSHDIIAHEVTHAILDGMHYHYNEPSNPDVLAFHEAFADIVALFQHFTFPEVLKHQIAQTKGDLESQNLLGKLAQEFGAAIGSYNSLRDAIGEVDRNTGEWRSRKPDPELYRKEMEPHERGSILVAAVFEAFINIYKSRIADLLRIATNGTGILPQGQLHPDLVNRLASEASKAASHVLNMCIRALDYCPPVDITFGEYLRAIITADYDLVMEDDRDYRLAFIEAFRRRGIYPEGIKTLSEESLRYACEPQLNVSTRELFNIIIEFLKEYRDEVIYLNDREAIYNVSRKYLGGDGKIIKGLHERLFLKFENSIEFEKLTGIIFNKQWARYGVRTTKPYENNEKGPSFRVQNLRVVSRSGPDGNRINYIVFTLVQRIGVVVKNGKFVKTYRPDDKRKPPEGGFEFWGGSTMIFDLDTVTVRYVISKPLLDVEKLTNNIREVCHDRILKQHRYQTEEGILSLSEQSVYFGTGLRSYFNEPFAFLHTHHHQHGKDQ
ncbi:hypothetical protein HRH25_22005 [Flavisolibacter sp. BT320]|nr:hypothetical protein [Flavisolibacter longurius]